MPELKNVTATAFIMAEFRGEENAAPDPLYEDAYVHLFLDDESRALAARVVEDFPLAKEMVKLRTRYFDDRLSAQLGHGTRQVVVLGSGLDTRAQRIAAPGVAFFEIDHADTLAFKARVLEREGVSANVTYVAGDYVAEGLVDMITGHGYDPARPTFFLWEGNTTYLALDDVSGVLRHVRERVPGCAIAFDYMSAKVISRGTGQDDLDSYIDHIAGLGAPWLSGIDDLEALAGELGLGLGDRFSAAELHQRYRPGRRLHSKLFDFYFVCTLLAR